MCKKNDSPKEFEDIISPERLNALKLFAVEMRARGYMPVVHLHPPAGVSLDYFVIDFVPIDTEGSAPVVIN
jgi:hypothetical protein